MWTELEERPSSRRPSGVGESRHDPAAIAGWPILAMPMGIIDRLPVGLAIIGRPGSEWMLLDAASRLEEIIHAEAPLPEPFWAAPSRG